MFFCKMASESDFETFLAPFWVHFGVIWEASGRLFGHFGKFFPRFIFRVGFQGFKADRRVYFLGPGAHQGNP